MSKMTEEEARAIMTRLKQAYINLKTISDLKKKTVKENIKAYDMAIKALEQEQKWIPVSERLPYNHEYRENNGLFNVSDGNRTYSEWFDIYDTQKFGEPTMYGFRVDHAVIAWMPLPKPYEPQERSE